MNADDRRWERLKNRSWVCPSCGNTHMGVFDLACFAPVYWEGPQTYSPNSIVLTSTHFLSEDFCVMEDKYYFIRCVLEIPILGTSGETFGYGIWCSASKSNFARYAESFDDPDRSSMEPWFGWFSNRLNGYPETVNLKCQAHPRGQRQRPLIELEPTDHPLASEQHGGISLDRLCEIYAVNGHDLRSALSDA